MPQLVDIFELGRLSLRSGEARRLDLHVSFDPFHFGGTPYRVAPDPAVVVLDVARMAGRGHALRLRFEACLKGPCMRCLGEAAPAVRVDAREVDDPAGGEELDSPYVHGEDLDLRAWARDALALELPEKLLCRPECAGLCPECGANLNDAGPEHHHDPAPDPRWAKLRELRPEE